MWWRGARVPILVWIGLLLGFAWLKLTLILDDYEFQMLGTKALAAFWNFVGFVEMKRANVTLRDGSIYQTFMKSEEHTSELQSPMRIPYAVFRLTQHSTNHHTSTLP